MLLLVDSGKMDALVPFCEIILYRAQPPEVEPPSNRSGGFFLFFFFTNMIEEASRGVAIAISSSVKGI